MFLSRVYLNIFARNGVRYLRKKNNGDNDNYVLITPHASVDIRSIIVKLS